MDGLIKDKIKIYHLLRTNLESRRLFSLEVNLLSANGIAWLIDRKPHWGGFCVAKSLGEKSHVSLHEVLLLVIYTTS